MNIRWGTAVAVVAFVTPASAEAPFTRSKLQFDLGAGYGWRIGSNDEDIHPWGGNRHRVGFSGRGGGTFSSGLYLGGAAEWFPWGESADIAYLSGGERREGTEHIPDEELTWRDVDVVLHQGPTHVSVVQVMLEAGYDLGFSRRLVFRPVLAAGIHLVLMMPDVVPPPPPGSTFFLESAFVLAPGGSLLADLGPVDGLLHVRYNLVTRGLSDALVLGAGLGMRF